MLKAVLLDGDTLGDASLDILRELPVELMVHGLTTPGQVEERISDADIVLTN